MINDLKNETLQVAVLPPTTGQNANFNTTAIDISQYDGNILCVLQAGVGSGTSPTFDIRAMSGAESNGANATNLNINFAQAANVNLINAITIDTRGAGKYLKFVGVIGGTSTPTLPLSIMLIGRKVVN